MDCFVIKAIVNELSAWFCPGLIKKIRQTSANTICLQIKGKKEGWLVFTASDPSPRLYVCSDAPKENFSKTGFALSLSKNIIGGKITKISVGELERIVQFTIIPTKAGHRLQPFVLIAELINHNSSLFFIEADSNKVLACSKMHQGKGRQLMPGDTYQPLAGPKKPNPFRIKASEFRELFLNWSQKEDLPGYLTRNLFGLSPIITEEIVFRAGLSHDIPSSTNLKIDRLWNSLTEVLGEYMSPATYPLVIIYPEKEKLPLLASFPLKSKIAYGDQKTFSTMNEAAEFFYPLFDKLCAYRHLKAQLEIILRRALQKYKNRLLHLNNDLESFKEAARAKEYGDIIMAHLSLIHKGMSDITLPDLYKGGEISISLDPSKSPIQNAQGYFKKYGKAKRGIGFIQDRKNKTEEMVNRLSQMESAAQMTKDLEELKEIGTALMQIVGKDQKKRGSKLAPDRSSQTHKMGKAAASAAAPPPGVRLFKIDEAWILMVGKTDKANDHLTRDLAKPEDIWLHVYNAPGSHVILKNPKRLENVPLEVLKKAASVAAFFSRQKNEDKALVSYTRKKYIRKPKGMKPGQVLLERQKTLLVKPSLDGISPIY